MKNILRLLTGYKTPISRTPNFFAPAYRTGRPLRLCALIFLCAFAPLRDLSAQKAIHELPAKTTIDTNYLFIQGNPTTGKLYKTRGAALNAFISGGGGTATDTTSLSNRIDLKLNISDTAGLSNRIDAIGPHIDTTSLSNRIDAISIGSTDTTSLSNRIDAIPTISSFSKNAGRDSTILLLSSGTRYAVKDSIGAGGGGGSQTLDGTLNLGNTTDTTIVFNKTGAVDNNFITVLPQQYDSVKQLDLTFGRHSHTNPASGINNEVFNFGFNVDGAEAGQPGLWESWESGYYPYSASDRWIEKHEIYKPTSGSSVRLSSYTIQPVANVIDFYHTIDYFSLKRPSTGTGYFSVENGQMVLSDGSTANVYLNTSSGNVLIRSTTTPQIPLIFRDFSTITFEVPVTFTQPLTNVPFSGALTNDNYGTSGYQMKIGSFFLQGYTTDKTFIMNNGYFNVGAGTYTRGATGYVSGINLYNGEVIIHSQNTGTGDFTLAIQAKSDYSGKFGIGVNIDYTLGSYTGATFYHDGATSQTGFGTTSPNASSIVDITSTTAGFLPPRMTKTQRDAISSPATGLVVYQTDNTPGLRCYNGTNWMRYTETTD